MDPPFPLAGPGFASIELCHDNLRICPERQWMSVVAVSRDDPIGWACALYHSGENRFLTNVKVAETAKLFAGYRGVRSVPQTASSAACLGAT